MHFQLISVLRNYGVLRDNSRKQLQEAAFKSQQSEAKLYVTAAAIRADVAVATLFLELQ